MLIRAALAFVILGAGQTGKPPKSSYDKVRDQTTYSTDSVRAIGGKRYEIAFVFPGKTPVKPENGTIQISTWHGNDSNDANKDIDGCEWNEVKEITLNVGGKVINLPAEYTRSISKDSMMAAFVGRVVVERLKATIPLELVTQMATSETLFAAGKVTGEIKDKGREPIKKLLAALPTS